MGGRGGGAGPIITNGGCCSSLGEEGVGAGVVRSVLEIENIRASDIGSYKCRGMLGSGGGGGGGGRRGETSDVARLSLQTDLSKDASRTLTSK